MRGTFNLLPLATYPVRTDQLLGPVTIAANTSGGQNYLFRLGCSNWGSLAESERIIVRIERSQNGGVNWVEAGAAVFAGGAQRNKQGVILTETNLGIRLPSPLDVGDQIRAFITNTAPIRTSVAVDIL